MYRFVAILSFVFFLPNFSNVCLASEPEPIQKTNSLNLFKYKEKDRFSAIITLQSDKDLYAFLNAQPAAIDFALSDKFHENYIPSLNAIAIQADGRTLLNFYEDPDVVQVWQIPTQLIVTYTRIMRALDNSLATIPLPAPANVSIAPGAEAWPLEGSNHEPLSRLTKISAEKGLVVVFGAGNYYANIAGEDNKGIINPWCFPDWVICVSAVDETGSFVYSRSARGKPHNSSTWPDVAANGIDVLGPFPTHLTKSKKRKKYDEGNEKFITNVEQKNWDIYTLESGTSQAAAQVSKALAQVLFFLKELKSHYQSKQIDTGSYTFTLTFPNELKGKFEKFKAKRLIGNLIYNSDSIEITYPIEPFWKVSKQLLIDVATPVAGAEPYEVGSSMIIPSDINQQFNQFGISEVLLAPQKVKP